MAKLPLRQFKGIAPKIPPKYLSESQAQKADNCRLDRGHLESWLDMSEVGELTKSGDIESIYLFAGEYWFHWDKDVDVVDAPIAEDTENKTVFTVNDGKETKPKITDAEIATSDGDGDIDDYPTTYYNLGIPEPENAIDADNSPDCDDSEQETVVYVYTYVNEYGFEGPPSPPSNSVDRCEGDTVDLSNMDTGPDGNYKVDEWSKRIYRSVTGTESTDYQFVKDVSIEDETASDSYETDELGEVLPTEGWGPPPDDLIGIIALPNGILVGFVGKDIYFSEPYIPSAWPVEYSLTVNEKIVGLGHIGTSVVVCTEGKPYLISGSHPANMSMTYLNVNQACVSKKGVASLTNGVVYPSPDGLVMVTTEGTKLITSKYLTRHQWQKYKPSSIRAGVYNDLYFAFYDNGDERKGFIVNPADEESGIMPLSVYANAMFTDLETDRFYLVTEDSDGDFKKLMEWEGSADSLKYEWKSKQFILPQWNFGCAQVVAESYEDLTFKLFVDGSEYVSKTVSSDKPFRLPGSKKGRVFEIELTGTDSVNEVYIANGMQELMTANE